MGPDHEGEVSSESPAEQGTSDRNVQRTRVTFDESSLSLVLIAVTLIGLVMVVAGFFLSRVNPSPVLYIGIVVLAAGTVLSYLDLRGILAKKLRRGRRGVLCRKPSMRTSSTTCSKRPA